MYSRNIGNYKKVNEYYRDQPSGSRGSPEKEIKYSLYTGPVKEKRETFSDNPTSKLETNYQVTKSGNKSDPIDMKLETKTFENTSNPSVWGPSFWFTLHNGAAKYPINASRHRRERMKGFILGIPSILPCKGCIPHAIAYLEESKPRLDDIVSGRDKLFEFFVDFHNNVNHRYGKPEFSYEDAYKLYKQGVNLTRMSYY